MNVKKPLTRLPSQGDELYMGSEKVVVLEIGSGLDGESV